MTNILNIRAFPTAAFIGSSPAWVVNYQDDFNNGQNDATLALDGQGTTDISTLPFPTYGDFHSAAIALKNTSSANNPAITDMCSNILALTNDVVVAQGGPSNWFTDFTLVFVDPEVEDQIQKDIADVVPGLIEGKVDKVEGKQLSTEDFTTDLLNKLIDLNSSSAERTTALLTLHPVSPGVGTTGGDTGVQIHATKDSSVSATYSTSVTYSLAGGNVSNVALKKCATNDPNEANWIGGNQTESSQSTGISVTVGQVVGQKGEISMDVPAGWFVKAVKTGSGTHTEAFVAGEQTIYG